MVYVYVFPYDSVFHNSMEGVICGVSVSYHDTSGLAVCSGSVVYCRYYAHSVLVGDGSVFDVCTEYKGRASPSNVLEEGNMPLSNGFGIDVECDIAYVV